MQVRRWVVAVAALVMMLMACAAALGGEAPRITKEKAKALLGTQKAVFIDVRTDGDWNESGRKIKGAVREEPGEVDKWAGKYPKEKEIILYCA